MKRPMRGFFLLLTTAGLMCAQTPAPPLAFEVATIKPGTQDIMALAQQMQSGKAPFRIDDHVFKIAFVRVRDLIAYAYEVPIAEITGPGEFLDGQRWEINATMPAGSKKEDAPKMMQTLLADRFGLKIHRETKEHAVYVLSVAKTGLKMKESEPDKPAADAPPPPPDSKDSRTIDVGQGPMTVKQDGKGGATIN